MPSINITVPEAIAIIESLPQEPMRLGPRVDEINEILMAFLPEGVKLSVEFPTVDGETSVWINRMEENDDRAYEGLPSAHFAAYLLSSDHSFDCDAVLGKGIFISSTYHTRPSDLGGVSGEGFYRLGETYNLTDFLSAFCEYLKDKESVDAQFDQFMTGKEDAVLLEKFRVLLPDILSAFNKLGAVHQAQVTSLVRSGVSGQGSFADGIQSVIGSDPAGPS